MTPISRIPAPQIVTLKTIIRFIVWIRLGYLFETDLARVVVNRMVRSFHHHITHNPVECPETPSYVHTHQNPQLPVPALRNQAMAVLCEIAGLTSGTEAYHTELTVIYSETMSQLVGVISPDMDLKEAYDVMDGHDGEFIQRLGLFLTNFYTNHLHVLEDPSLAEPLQIGMTYLIQISRVNELEIFKFCIEFCAFFLVGGCIFIHMLILSSAFSTLEALTTSPSQGAYLHVICLTKQGGVRQE